MAEAHHEGEQKQPTPEKQADRRAFDLQRLSRKRREKKMTHEEAAAKIAADKKSVELYRAAHRNYLNRTGQTEATSRKAIVKTLKEKR
jgi:hypothetical protein